MDEVSRRRFLEFLGRSSVLGLGPALTTPGCTRATPPKPPKHGAAIPEPPAAPSSGLVPIEPTRADALVLAEGFEYYTLIHEGDPLNSSGERFGVSSDYVATLPLPGDANPRRRIMWVNHEAPTNRLLHGLTKGAKKTKQQVELDQISVGGSLVAIEQAAAEPGNGEPGNGEKWAVLPNHPLNRRITGKTPIPIVAPRAIEGSTVALGTMANCAGGYTPWNTFLTCEENYDNYYGERIYAADGTRTWTDTGLDYNHWSDYFSQPPEHYGWVVEVDPKTGSAKKLTSIGRYAHESATVVQAQDGRCVVYSADDMKFGSFYKFIADRPGTLETGTLYVANLDAGRWEPLTLERPELKSRFKDQTEILIRAREAALLVGGSQLDRPEDVEIDPVSGAVLVTFTNNHSRTPKNYHGSVMKFVERNGDHLAMEFESSVFVTGGEASGLSCPDNIAFDPAGNLWIASDISGKDIGRPPYDRFGNNGLYVVQMQGPDAGKPLQVASSPVEAEFTGLSFAPDGKTLFVAVQHPGEYSPLGGEYSSHWPRGGNSKPLSTVVAITGPGLQRLTAS